MSEDEDDLGYTPCSYPSGQLQSSGGQSGTWECGSSDLVGHGSKGEPGGMSALRNLRNPYYKSVCLWHTSYLLIASHSQVICTIKLGIKISRYLCLIMIQYHSKTISDKNNIEWLPSPIHTHTHAQTPREEPLTVWTVPSVNRWTNQFIHSLQPLGSAVHAVGVYEVVILVCGGTREQPQLWKATTNNTRHAFVLSYRNNS